MIRLKWERFGGSYLWKNLDFSSELGSDISADFHSKGNVPEQKTLFNRLVMDGANWVAHSFKTLGGISSGSGQLLIFKFFKHLSTSSVVQIICTIKENSKEMNV